MEGKPARLLAGTRDGELSLDRVQADGEQEIDGPAFAARYVPAAGVIAGEEVS